MNIGMAPIGHRMKPRNRTAVRAALVKLSRKLRKPRTEARNGSAKWKKEVEFGIWNLEVQNGKWEVNLENHEMEITNGKCEVNLENGNTIWKLEGWHLSATVRTASQTIVRSEPFYSARVGPRRTNYSRLQVLRRAR